MPEEIKKNPGPEHVTLIKVDPWSILKIVLIFLALWFLYLIRDVILIVLSALFLAAVITPAVNFFEKKKLPRWLGALIIYLVIFLVVALVGFAAGKTIVEQFKLFIQNLPEYLRSFFQSRQVETEAGFWNFLTNWLGRGAPGESIFSILGTLAGQFITFFMIFVIAFYLSIEKRAFHFFINTVLPIKYRRFAGDFVNSAQKEIGAWARGMFFLCLAIGILTYLGLLILGVKFSLVLGIIAGFTELIPWIGPWIGAVPAIIIALAQSPIKALLVVILYLVVQQIGNTFITPHVMRRAVGLDPLLVLIVLLIGGKIAGPWGMLLAVPVATIIAILIRDYLKTRPPTLQQ